MLAALSESEARLRLALDLAELGTWAWDLSTGAGDLDARGAEIVGLPSGAFADAFVEQRRRVHPDDLAQLDADIAAGLAAGAVFNLSYRVVHPDGSVHHVTSRARVHVDEHGRPARLVGINRDVTRERAAEAALRTSEARQTFLLQLNDRLRPLSDPEAIQYEAARTLGELLQVDRVGYAEDQADDETIVVTRNYTCGVSGIEGRYRYDDYGPELLRAFRVGRMVVRPDIANDPTLTAAEKAAHAVLNLGATVNVPLLRAGRLVAVLFMHSRAARAWSDDELMLLQEVAERTWDAVERARAEAELRASEARYRTLLDRIDQGFCRFEMLYDAEDNPADYRFLEVNRTFERHTGLRNVVGKTARELVPDLEPFWFATYGRVAETGEPLRFEQGSPVMGRLFEIEAVRVGPAERRQVALLFTDVTERRRNEAALAAAAARDQYLVRLADALRPLSDAVAVERAATRVLGEHLGASRVAYFEVDGEDYVAERYYSNGVETPTGRFPSTSFGPGQLATYQAGRTVIDPDVVGNPELTPAEQATYATYQIAAHVGVPLVKDGRFVAGLVVHQTTPRAWTPDDVALIEETAERTWAAIERARAEGRLQALYAQEQAARRAAEEAGRLKDEFLATVSHELRTPLTAFLGYAELLLRRTRDAAYVQRTAAKMVQSAKAQAVLIEDLLDISRIVSGKLRLAPEPIDLRQVIGAALDTMRPAVEAKGLHLQVTLDPAASSVRGDGNRLQQVIWNLLANATKFTPAGGRIHVGLAAAEGCAVITVADTGHGVAATLLPHIFAPFRQGDSSSQRAYGGLGLGLAIVKHLVELHGGSVAVTSDGPGRGATFTVWLPLAPPQPHHGPGEGVIAPEPPLLDGRRVLLVDDQHAILDVLTELLAAEGAVVEACATADEALGTLRAWRPEVLVCDIAMPGRDGYWLIEQVRGLPPEEGGETPAVALTAYVQMEDRLRVLAAGFQRYLTKPVDAAELRAVLHGLLEDDGDL